MVEGLDDFAIAYLDDIVVLSSIFEEHLNHTQIIFDWLRQHEFNLKLKKVSLTKYLGFVINDHGI